jgi:hypothetical protein
MKVRHTAPLLLYRQDAKDAKFHSFGLGALGVLAVDSVILN